MVQISVLSVEGQFIQIHLKECVYSESADQNLLMWWTVAVVLPPRIESVAFLTLEMVLKSMQGDLETTIIWNL